MKDLAIHALSELFGVVGNADIVMCSRPSVSGGVLGVNYAPHVSAKRWSSG